MTWPWQKLRHVLNANTRSGSRSNIAAHYDLGNDLYEAMLDDVLARARARSEQASATE